MAFISQDAIATPDAAPDPARPGKDCSQFDWILTSDTAQKKLRPVDVFCKQKDSMETIYLEKVTYEIYLEKYIWRRKFTYEMLRTNVACKKRSSNRNPMHVPSEDFQAKR